MSRYHLKHCLIGITIFFVSSIVADEAIVSGQIAEEQEFPYQVSLFYYKTRPICGGAIIGDKHILTAAHCVLHLFSGQLIGKKLMILAGTNSQYRTNEPTVIMELARIFIPAEFKHVVLNNVGDIAVLELKESLELRKNTRYLRKVKLPKNQRENYDGRTAMIAGFGWNWVKIENNTKYGNNTDGRLRFSEADIITKQQCQQHFPRLQLSDKDICAQLKQPDNNVRRATCRGDSGSPLILDNSTVIGILSRSSGICDERIQSAIYTRVSHYLTFIANALKGKLNKNMRVYTIPETVI